MKSFISIYSTDFWIDRVKNYFAGKNVKMFLQCQNASQHFKLIDI